SNSPVDNVTFTTTATNGRISSIPDLCLTTGVVPQSGISADGRTLTCNVGTKDQGTAVVVMVPVTVDGPTGGAVSLAGQINGQPASVPEIPIQNAFGMDMRWGVGSANFASNADSFSVDYEWTLSKDAGSEAGPDSVSYDLSIVSPQGSAISLAQSPACTPYTIPSAADGHPWSGGDHPENQMANFVDSCTLTQTGPNTFRLTLTGIDYDPVSAPTLDSAGKRLPTDQVALASGSIWIRIATTAEGSAELTSSAPTYAAAGGQATAVDDPSNNTESKSWTTPGTYSSGWGRGYTKSGGTTWDKTYQVAAGTTIGQYMDTAFQLHTHRADTKQIGMCSALDTRYVTYERFQWDTPVAGSTVEYYTGSAATVDPSSASYDPNTFDCGTTTGWIAAEPGDPATVKAVRVLIPQGNAEQTGLSHITPVVYQTIRPETPAGTDVWSFFSGIVDFDATTSDWWNGTGCIATTPGLRYPCTTGFRDLVRVISATPSIKKSVDRSVITPGIPATYTLTYSANGAGAIPATVDDFGIADTLPAGMTYVAGSATPEPAVSTNGSGQQVLTWSLDAVPTNADHALTYRAVVDDSATPGQALTNSATATLGGVSNGPATAQVTV
ncbi:DUF11 domain-containing protein, partial [Arthrobacter sp. NamB2]